MSKEVDWQETDRLVEQLRAKLAEDPDFIKNAEGDLTIDTVADPPKPSAPAPADGHRSETVGEKTPSKKAARRTTARKRQEQADAAPKAEQTAKKAPAKSAPTPKKKPSEGTKPPAKPQAAPAAPPAERSNLFASAYRRDEDDYVARTAPAAKPAPTHKTESTELPDVEQIVADQTVDNLLHDLFGNAAGWSTEQEPPAKKPPVREKAPAAPKPKQTPAQEPPKEAPKAAPKEPPKEAPKAAPKEPPKEAPKAAPKEPPKAPQKEAPKAAPKETPKASPKAPAAPPAKRIRAKQVHPKTVARKQDGQMTLVLPETKAAPPADAPAAPPAPELRSVHRRTLEERVSLNDDGQINLFALFSAEGRRSGETEEEAAARIARANERMEFKRSVESSDEDFRLLMGLDYENELGNAIGFEKIREFHEAGDRRKPPKSGKGNKSGKRTRVAGKLEFEGQSQVTDLRGGYTRQKREHFTRLVLSLVLTLFILLYEGTNLFGALFGGPFDGVTYPVSYILIGIQLLVLIAFFSKQRLIEGFVRLVHFSPIDYSLCSVMFIATVLYHLVLIFMPHAGRPALYLSPAAVSILLLALADLLNWRRESLAFLVVSSSKQKYALLPRMSVGGKEGNARISLEEPDTGNLWYAHSVGFVRNYFTNTEKRVAHSRTLGAQLLLILSVGFSVGLFVLASGGSAADTLRTVFVTFLICAPAVSLLVTALPMFLGASLRLRKRSAIIGEAPIYQCQGSTTLVLPDTEVFTPMRHERFELVENCDPQEVTVLVRALLDRLKSPMRESVSIERDLRMSPDCIELTEVQEHGVSAIADGKTELLMGNMDYMQRYGIRVQPRAGGDYDDICRRLICVAVDHKVSALFLARYRLNDNMIDLLRELEENDVQVMVRTADPGINNELMARLLPDRRDPVLVMKPSANEIDLGTESVDANIVSLGSCKEVARTFITCRRICRARRVGKLLQALSVGLGAVIAGLCAFFGGTVAIPSILVSLYLLSFCGIHAITSTVHLREKTDE